MFKEVLTALLVAFFLYLPTSNAEARGYHYSYSARSGHQSSTFSGSHHVKSYYRQSGVYVRPHFAGNKHSGNHWHLNKDGSDTLTKPNGTTVTIPTVN